ncbi:MAG TPA: hypothetical protein VFL85_00765 [Candidatus Saccharimonadales bacterium]|nr:hypothetical protein [Candidatus Saccharimonadales bacterium]
MKITNKQSGFAIVEALVILVLVIAIAGAGYYVWHARQSQKSQAASSKPSINTPATTQTKAIANFAECKAATGSKILETFPEQCVTKDGQKFVADSGESSQQYLVIREWSVKLPLTNEIKDAYYTYKVVDTPDYGSVVYLGTTSLTAMDARCAPEKIGVAAIFRQSIAQHDAALKSGHAENVGSVRLGDYYYGYSQAQSACGDTIESAASKQQAADMQVFQSKFMQLRTAN